jgi:FkbM family methyltransferase
MVSLLKKAARFPFHALGLEVKRRGTDPLDYLLRQREFRTVLDIGAHTGVFAREIRKSLPTAQIYSFEPLTGPFERLRAGMGNDPNFEAFQIAVGERNGRTLIHQDDFTPASSLLTMTETTKKAFPHTGKGTSVEIPLQTLDSWAEAHKLESPLLVKMDVQGYEDKVIQGAEEVLKRADAVITEASFVELYEGQPLYCELQRLMEGRGFQMLGAVVESYDSRGLAMQADVFYIKQNQFTSL